MNIDQIILLWDCAFNIIRRLAVTELYSSFTTFMQLIQPITNQAQIVFGEKKVESLAEK